LTFFKHYLASLASDAKPELTEKLLSIEVGLEALRNVIRNNDGVEIQCIGHFKLLFMLLRLGNLSPKLQTLTLEMLLAVTANKDCVSDIASSDVLLNLLLVLHSFQAGQQLALDCLYALSSSSKIVKDMTQTGGFFNCLFIYSNILLNLKNRSNVRFHFINKKLGIMNLTSWLKYDHEIIKNDNLC
jgi:DnaJ family protein C protein 13